MNVLSGDNSFSLVQMSCVNLNSTLENIIKLLHEFCDDEVINKTIPGEVCEKIEHIADIFTTNHKIVKSYIGWKFLTPTVTPNGNSDSLFVGHTFGWLVMLYYYAFGDIFQGKYLFLAAKQLARRPGANIYIDPLLKLFNPPQIKTPVETKKDYKVDDWVNEYLQQNPQNGGQSNTQPDNNENRSLMSSIFKTIFTWRDKTSEDKKENKQENMPKNLGYVILKFAEADPSTRISLMRILNHIKRHTKSGKLQDNYFDIFPATIFDTDEQRLNKAIKEWWQEDDATSRITRVVWPKLRQSINNMTLEELGKLMGYRMHSHLQSFNINT